MEYSTTNSAFTGLSRRRLDIRLYPHVLPSLTEDAYRRRWACDHRMAVAEMRQKLPGRL